MCVTNTASLNLVSYIHVFVHVFLIHTYILYSHRAECSYLTSTTHPRIPLRLVAICNDSTIRIISPVNGTKLTTALLPASSTITSVAYMPSHGNVYVCVCVTTSTIMCICMYDIRVCECCRMSSCVHMS